jgi:single-strand DNA-binding protein
MPQNSITISGNLTGDPEIRFTPNGKPVARFTLAYSERYRDNATGEWKDGDTSYFDVYAWDDLGEHIAETFQRGNRAIVTGIMRMRSWETPEGDKRRTYEIRADDVGASVRFATARIAKATRARPASPDTADPWSAGSAARPATEPAEESPAEPAPASPEKPADGPAATADATGPGSAGSRSRPRSRKPAA